LPDVSFVNLLVVGSVAFLAPLALGLFPRIRLPAAVLEIAAGVALGPAGLGWVEPDEPVAILSVMGLAFLLFLAGYEIDLHRLRGRLPRLAGAGFALSVVLAAAAGYGLSAAGLVETAPLVAIMLVATSLGLVVPVLTDAGEARSALGQLVIAGASIADFGAIILLSLLFSRESSGAGATLALLGGVALSAALVVLVLIGVGRSMRLSDVMVRLQDTTAQIRVRGAVLLLLAFVALAERLGLEVILGAFVAGAILRFVDRDVKMTHPILPMKLDAIGYGFLIPVFFVTSGLRFDLGTLFADASAIARIPLFLVALLLVRGLPAILYRGLVGGRRSLVAGLLQATSLPFIVAAAGIGLELGVVGEGTATGMIAAGLLSVLVFPAVALTLLRDRRPEPLATQG
jgi:Kef-type K+ transport system membrane component KefB